MDKLKPCPCGRHVSDVDITDAGQGGKWANVSGNCCGEWTIEFRTQYLDLASPECKALGVEAWNEATRAQED